MNLQALINAAGQLPWISDELPGSVHDLTAARTHGIIGAVTAAQLQTLADKGYQSAGGTVTTPLKGKHLTDGQRHINSLINRRRGPGERAFATLKSWKIFAKVHAAHTASDQWLKPHWPSSLDQNDHNASGWKRLNVGIESKGAGPCGGHRPFKICLDTTQAEIKSGLAGP